MTRRAAASPYKRSRRNPESRNCGPYSSSLAEVPTRATRFRASAASQIPARSHEFYLIPEAHWRQRWAIAPQTQNIQRPQPYTDQYEELTTMLLSIAELDHQNLAREFWKF